MNSVNEYVAKNDEREANRFITSFSRLMRRVLDDSKNTFIPLSDEIEMLKVYVQLEHSRFPDQFQYHIECGGVSDPSDIFIPPMMLQPLLENAIGMA
ncbi:MAG: sensor histidine kinase [Flavobacteriales bacterium]|nr:sensor histidine kinase [Flavobacteriales bacterium]